MMCSREGYHNSDYELSGSICWPDDKGQDGLSNSAAGMSVTRT